MNATVQGMGMILRVGGLELYRTAHVALRYTRRAIVSVCEVDIPDPQGDVSGHDLMGTPVELAFWYRGGGLGERHEWQGTVERVEQIQTLTGVDTARIYAIGMEKRLVTTRITEAMYGEPADAVARRLLARTGLPVAHVAVPQDILPHSVFSGVTVAAAIKQLAWSLERSFGHDLSSHAVWLGKAGLYWSAEDEPCSVPRIASGETLLSHGANRNGQSEIVSILYPGIRDSQRVLLVDARRGIRERVRVEEVVHTLSATQGNTTVIRYGVQYGWG